ncbi:MAG: LytTR family DNA-binding domain-containing protein [Rikenellaceae bacterium]
MNNNNSPIKCIAIDDEPLALSLIEGYMKRHPNIELLTFTDPMEGIELIKNQNPDLVLLDIEMNEYSGLELARELPDESLLIFTTAHAIYAVDGYELRAIDFLHKPFTYERFASAIFRAERIMDIRNRVSAIDEIELGSITIKTGLRNITIKYSDIAYIESMANYLKIQYINNDCNVLTRMSIKAIMEMLPKSIFVRTHRSFIVSKSQIASFSRQNVILKDSKPTVIPVGRLYAEQCYTELTTK